MTIPALQVLAATGETGYIGKHNSNYAAIQGHLNTLFGRLVMLGANDVTISFDAIFGTEVAFIGADSYAAEIDGEDLSQVLVGPGFCFKYSRHVAVLNPLPSTALTLAGQEPGTYYISAAQTGSPQVVADATDALWSLEWDGAEVTELTRVARTVESPADLVATQHSTALDTDYPRLADRLEAIETSIEESAYSLAGEFPPASTPGGVLVSDGAEWVPRDRHYIIRGWSPGTVDGSFDLDNIITVVPFEILEASTARAKAGVAPTFDCSADVTKNGTPFGTLSFAAADAGEGIFVFDADTSFAEDDEFGIGPLSDPTLGDIRYSIAGRLLPSA